MKRIESGRWQWAAGIVLGGAVALAGCGPGEKTLCPDTNPFCESSVGSASPTPAPRTPQRVCTARTDCPSGSTCFQGDCVPDEDLAAEDLPVPCRTAQDCGAGETCVEITGQRLGVCQAVLSELNFEKPNAEVIPTVPVRPPPQGAGAACSPDQPCAAGLACINGVCGAVAQPQVTLDTCVTDADCGTPAVCEGGVCVLK